MAKLALLLTVVSLLNISINAIPRICIGEHCNPNWTPFDNMVYALRGYNIRSGNPIHSEGDPGFGAQIFVPTMRHKDGSMELETGITASELSYCERSVTSKSFTTIDSYRKYVAESSSSGVNLQIGTDKEVTAGIDIGGLVDVSSTQTIPKPFSRAWGNSKDFQEVTKFFSEKQGMISTSMAKCIVYEMSLDTFHLPSFTTPFTHALVELYTARNNLDHVKKALFRKFIGQYGTHFLIESKMGAQYIYRTKYTKTVRDTMTANTLKDCNYVEGSKIFGIQIEPDSTNCKQTDMNKINQMRRENIKATIITKGSRPTGQVEDWATQEFHPIPLAFKLSPIVNLMTEKYINNVNLNHNTRPISASAIRKWFVPLYFDYCNSMLIDCGDQSGCGIDDKCPVDSICKKGGNKHECGEWTEWSCTVNCGQGKQQKRTRQCIGCTGVTEQKRNHDCKPQKECFGDWTCYWKNTGWNYDRRPVYLDRHHMVCGTGYALNYFKLERNNDHDRIRYKYRCCSTQLSCSSTLVRNPMTDSGASEGNIVYLDRQNAMCYDNYISSFKLYRNGRKWRYEYDCCKMLYRRTCHSKSTSFNDDSGLVYLDRHTVDCGTGYNLVSFYLNRNSGHNKMRYSYRCCKTIKP